MNKWIVSMLKSVTGGRVMTFCVCLLVLVQIAFIVNIMVIVNKGYGSEITNVDRQIDSGSDILLSLITFCVTMAVVIPYVIGKSITQTDIRNVVLEHNKQYDNKIDETVKSLEWSEAHLSRMIAYFLLDKREIRPEWAIGWASKSLIRYLKQDAPKPWTADFCDECVRYISEGIALLNNETSGKTDDKPGVRAIKDAYDAWSMVSCSKIYKADFDVRNSLKEGIREMWKSLVLDGKYTEKSLVNEIAQASKYKLYLGSSATERDFVEKFRSDIL